MFHNLPGYAQEERWLFPWVVEIPKEPFLSAQKTGFYKYYIGSFEFPCGFRSSLKSSDSLCCDLRSLDSSNFDNKKFRLNVDTMPLLPPFLPCLGHDNCKMRESTEKSLAPDTTQKCRWQVFLLCIIHKVAGVFYARCVDLRYDASQLPGVYCDSR